MYIREIIGQISLLKLETEILLSKLLSIESKIGKRKN